MNNDQYQAQINGEKDANTDVVKFLWIAVGFFANIIGILIAAIYQPTPPATRLFEKSQEYTAFYTEAYKAKARSIQLTYTAVGFAIGAGVGILIFIGSISVMRNVSNMGY